uniref:Uncharacterized protein n=1 Tax=Anguilla anguilla TaxID=7936 RepID=A0A0E9VS00_ANGAN
MFLCKVYMWFIIMWFILHLW